ncbi:hypothetical protein [Chitinophaga arvensicola]|uniref:Uncharacterized protein n=1 Tax=Chitinophaga arvensicola TaxID=29529 RepID=A0A1I0RSF0_9BACT|nr:hypothetical protein [Chitinophaga arvensicola]SEW44284.1 hypothetical protein SAMN04488122_3314 [Chitinophaga arvensicola]
MSVLPDMPIRKCLYAFSLLCLSIPGIVSAQMSGPENVMIDGKLSEWADPLPNFDKATLLYYVVHNDKDFLYIAIKRSRWAEKIRAEGRILFSVGATGVKGNTLKIVYPASDNYDPVDMWNFLQFSQPGSRNTTTETIYNDYGIQAGGRFWTTTAENGDKASSSSGQSEKPMNAVSGADCELAIPLKLLPATTSGYTIQISLRGDAASASAVSVLSSLGGMRLPPEIEDKVRDTNTSTTLTINYSLK